MRMAKQGAKIQQLPIDVLQPNPLHPRDNIDEGSLQELKESIALQGILEPILVASTPAGYQIIAGERRWRAAKLVGLTTIPAVVREVSPQQMLEMALVEDIQQQRLNPLDRAKAFKRLHDEFDLSIKAIAQKIGKSSAYVINSIRLLRLPDALKDGLLSGLISEGHARALMGLGNTKIIIEVYKQVLREHASVRRTEELARITKRGENEAQRDVISYSHVESLHNYLEKKLNIPGMMIKIDQTRSMLKISLRARGYGNKEKLFFRFSDLVGWSKRTKGV